MKTKNIMVVFMDIEKYSRRNAVRQKKVIDHFTKCLNQIKQHFEEILKSNKHSFEKDCIFIPTGDGILIIFCFNDISDIHIKFAKKFLEKIYENNKEDACSEFDNEGWCSCHDKFNVRIGISDGKGIIYKDINKFTNIASTAINMAARIVNLIERNQIAFTEQAYNNFIDFCTQGKYDKKFIKCDAEIKHNLKIIYYVYKGNDDEKYINSEISEGEIIDKGNGKVKRNKKGQYVLHIYIRDTSDHDMILDMAKHSILYFLGISHQNLLSYFERLLNKNAKPLKIKSIIVLYASDVSGRMYEGAPFVTNLQKTRQNIATLFTNPMWRKKLPVFKSVSFRQCKHPATFGGCMFTDENDNSIFFVVNYLPDQKTDLRKALTFKLSQNKELGHLREKYRISYYYLINESENIGTFKPSLWDISVNEWSIFATKCNAHRKSMEFLVELSNLKGNEKVMDLAAGPGTVSEILLNALPKGKLTLLDNSPQMLEKSRQKFGNHVHYALCTAGAIEKENFIDLEGAYDTILIHLSIPAIATNQMELKRLAFWCNSQLKENGKVVMACLNTAVETSSNYDTRSDILRQTIKNILDKMKLGYKYRTINRHKFTQREIEKAFTDTGFNCNVCEQSFNITMQDRILMWSVPSVLNDVVDVRQLGMQQIRNLINKLSREIGDNVTPKMVVKYWTFVKRKII